MLVLRQEIEGLFKSAKVPELTIGRSVEGRLQVEGKECGQPIMELTKFTVTSKFTKVEREIIINDYIIPLLHTYGKELNTFITTSKTLHAHEIAHEKMREEYMTKYNISYRNTFSNNDIYQLTYSEKAGNRNFIDFSARDLEDIQHVCFYGKPSELIQFTKRAIKNIKFGVNLVLDADRIQVQIKKVDELRLKLQKDCKF